jgi:hypothetical protein
MSFSFCSVEEREEAARYVGAVELIHRLGSHTLGLGYVEGAVCIAWMFRVTRVFGGTIRVVVKEGIVIECGRVVVRGTLGVITPRGI